MNGYSKLSIHEISAKQYKRHLTYFQERYSKLFEGLLVAGAHTQKISQLVVGWL